MRKLYNFIFFFLPAFAFAQDCTGIICNPIGHMRTSANKPVETVNDFIDIALVIMIQITIPITAIFILISGYNFATSGGDQKKLEKAKSSLQYVLIGLAIILLSKGIQMTLQSTIESLK